jgi:tetratricopeptide (TPR) repeat protein
MIFSACGLSQAKLDVTPTPGVADTLASPTARPTTITATNTLKPFDSTNAEAYLNRGLDYYNNGDLDNAISAYDQAIQLNTNYAEAYNNRGQSYSDRGDLDHAIHDYDQAIQLNPNLAEAYNNRGVAYYL